MLKFNASIIEKAFSETVDSLIQDKNSSVVVAFSGGADSLALLALCTKHFENDKIFPVYVNHKIRSDKELNSEITLNTENCLKLGLKLNIWEISKEKLNKLSKENGLEAAARKLRYEELEKFASVNGCSYILTAHHKDDQLETLYMKASKKSPVSSLRGIAQVKGKIVRPLLDFDKKILEKYLKYNGLKWSIDSTNKNNLYERNKVRNVLLPRFKRHNLNAETFLLDLRKNALFECEDFVWEKNYIEIEYFNSLNEAKKFIVIYSMWDRVVGGLISMNMVNRVIKSCSNKMAMESAAGGTFFVYQGSLFLLSDKETARYSKIREKFVSGAEIADFECNILEDSSNKKALHLDINQLKGDAYLCFPKIGDRISLASGSKTVIKVLQDMKIPRALRFRTPIIVDGDGVVALFGSVWGGKDRLAKRFKTSSYENSPCVIITCKNK